MKFRTIYDYDSLPTCSGTIVECVDETTGEKLKTAGRRYTYAVEYDKKGKRSLVISGTEDVYQYIQSFKDDTDIYKILKRLNGDLTQLDSNKGFYADVTQIPRDINEWYNKIEQAKDIYAGLPTDLKNKFGNSINEFVASVYNQDFEKRYNDYLVESGRVKLPVENNVESEVKKGE